MTHAIRRSYKLIKDKGEDDAAKLGLDPRGFFNLMGMEKEMEIDRLAGGHAFEKVA